MNFDRHQKPPPPNTSNELLEEVRRTNRLLVQILEVLKAIEAEVKPVPVPIHPAVSGHLVLGAPISKQ